ncbi:MAG: two-component sensor histidine kinase [Spirochaetaceae bacterium]|jgi:two-component system phosphate regulon sensor histidine kinase PhoR|nr:two-component sensor histidine kinase [Spirochaetaceae bacterium]
MNEPGNAAAPETPAAPSIKKRIYLSILSLLALSLLLASSALCLVFYRRLSAAARAEIRSRAEAFARSPAALDLLGASGAAGAVRVTLVAPDGTVLWDNAAGTGRAVPPQLPNHGDREEIREALLSGSGESRRFSETLEQETFYYALRLEDGHVLRTARTTASVFSVFFSALPVMAAMVLLVMLAGYAAAKHLTNRLVAPINNMRFNTLSTPPYEELRPLVAAIADQREQIALHLTQLKKAEKLRREFTANVSHELATPLTSMSGYAEMLDNGMVAESDKPAFIRKIKDETARLIALVKDVMVLSQMDEGKSDGPFEEVDLALAARESVEVLSRKAAEHGVSVRLGGGEAVIRANRTMMAELFYNLIDNAIKYNKPGGTVRVEISRDGGRVSLSVSDTGIGIPREAQDKVFERFYRTDKSRSRKTGGTGLGLAIVKHIALLHHGEISLDSREDEGTRISVTFSAPE